MKWNPSQLKAINTTNTNIVVSASAGAGKTTVLVNRLMKRLLDDHISIDHVLAMTFTEAAASEMKKRLLKELDLKIKNPQTSNTDREYCQKQLILLETANISTIHSFCLSIIKANYASIGLNPNRINNLLDDSGVKELIHQALNNIFNEELSSNYTLFCDCNQYLSNSIYTFNELENCILDLIKSANNMLNPIQWLDYIQNINHEVKSFVEINPLIKDIYLKDLKIKLLDVTNTLKKLLDLVNNKEEYSKESAIIDDYLSTINEVNDLFDTSLQQAIDLLKEKTKPKLLPTIRKFDEYKILRDSFHKQLATFTEELEDEETIIANYNKANIYGNYIIDLAKKTYLSYNQLKEQHEVIDFNDMEHFAYEILMANNQELKIYYQNLFDEIMVDEFQDSNNTQNEIINLIARNNNVFRVGDVKQSIYKFRGAKPSIMQDLLESNSAMNIYLSNNYRSLKTIVEFNNKLFSNLMNINGLSINYKHYDNQIADLDRQLVNNEPVSIHLINLDEIDEELGTNNSKIKSDYIAYMINKMHETTQYDKWSDYCVLLRSHTDKKELKQAFARYNIPCFVDDHTGFLNSYAISIVLSYLYILKDLNDYISLVAVLSSPLYEFNDNDLVNIKDNFIGNLENHRFIHDYNKLLNILSTDGLVACISYILTINEFYNNALNIQEKSNIDLLLQKASNYNFDTIDNFIDFIESTIDDNTEGASFVSNEDNVVQAMTIHRSKGLEFKVVFFYSNSRLEHRESKNNYIIDERLGLGLTNQELPYRFTTKTINSKAIVALSNIEDIEESLRVLYVALTRPKERLFIIDTIKNDDKYPLDMSLLYARKGFTSYILNALPDDPTLYDIKIITDHWDKKVNKARYTQNENIIKYTQEEVNISSITPSSMEATSYDLNLNHYGSNVGTTIHQVIEKLPNREWTNDDFNNLALSNKQITKLINFSKTEIYKQCLDYEIHKEYNFNILVDNELIHGSIDFLAVGDEIILVDFKTDINVDENELINRYADQIKTYNKAIKTLYDKNIQCYLYSFSLEKYIKIGDF